MRRGLGIHVALLGVVLLLLLALSGTHGVVHSDEGAMLAQLELLEETGDWTLPNPEPEVDPGLRALPFQLSDRTAEGDWAPFSKHPVHIWLLGPAYAAGGAGGVLVVSVAGAVLAAACAGILAERLRSGIGPAVVWLVGVGSPVVFYADQVIGHALAAGFFGAATVLAVSAGGRRSTAGRVAVLLLSAAAVALTGLVRTEGILAGLALGGAVGLFGLLRRRWWEVATGAACGVAAVAARVLEPRLIESVLGGPSVGSLDFGIEPAQGGLSGRWSAFRLTVLDDGYGVDGGEVLATVALVLALGAVALWRWRCDGPAFRLLVVGAAGAAVARLLAADFLVPGLLPAVPLLAVGLVLLDRRSLGEWPSGALWLAGAAFVAAVVATEYEIGGSGEWGGRFFVLGLPVLVAVAAASAARGTADLPSATRRLGHGCLAVVTITLAIGAIRVTDEARDGTRVRTERVIDAVESLEVDAALSTDAPFTRFAWDDVLDGSQWLTMPTSELETITEGLAEQGAERLALVTIDPDDDVEALAAGWRVAGEEAVAPGTTVLLLTR